MQCLLSLSRSAQFCEKKRTHSVNLSAVTLSLSLSLLRSGGALRVCEPVSADPRP